MEPTWATDILDMAVQMEPGHVLTTVFDHAGDILNEMNEKNMLNGNPDITFANGVTVGSPTLLGAGPSESLTADIDNLLAETIGTQTQRSEPLTLDDLEASLPPPKEQKGRRIDQGNLGLEGENSRMVLQGGEECEKQRMNEEEGSSLSKEGPSLSNFTLSGPPTNSTVTTNIHDAAETKKAVKDIRSDVWKLRIKNSTNFDLFAPGLITLLDFDGIELWAMDSKNGDVVNIADTVRDETLLKWSWDSNSWKLAAGKGMIGRVYLTGIAEWQNDISRVKDNVFLRCPIAQRIGVKGVGCIPCEAPTGDQIIVFLYTRKPLGFDKNLARKQFVEDMVNQWMRNCRKQVKFHSSKKATVRMIVKRGQKGSTSVSLHKKVPGNSSSTAMPPPKERRKKIQKRRKMRDEDQPFAEAG
mmetsp:Transcript_29073/g.70915  ORF Transcript_29073/g.70915 Transcript_29073/m.70915 type:complete len:413 (-) Transcript_29073:453-1691(-)|eukprot:CAMPEP_0114516510 /NCGR_PEP_ID=MMETSP0109-20121206/17368_1 /TAXON_ID=29199 /ORGANISM="Chlorarachnion reptans, Strain CCCM449" /LENGTH=412 /DNA_ID=CAMNT_0001696907 /DNA_START=308 /DNA_END=1546 /DNA_ORIENTATION=-